MSLKISSERAGNWIGRDDEIVTNDGHVNGHCGYTPLIYGRDGSSPELHDGIRAAIRRLVCKGHDHGFRRRNYAAKFSAPEVVPIVYPVSKVWSTDGKACRGAITAGAAE